jgi:hypothetical protein
LAKDERGSKIASSGRPDLVDSIDLRWPEDTGKPFAESGSGLVTEVTSVHVPVLAREIVVAGQFGGTSSDESPDDWMRMRVIVFDQLIQRGFFEIAKKQSLAEMDIAVAVDVNPAGIDKILIGTLVEITPWPAGKVRSELSHCAPPKTNRASDDGLALPVRRNAGARRIDGDDGFIEAEALRRLSCETWSRVVDVAGVERIAR